MASTFALVATLAAVGAGWVVEANDDGRLAALALLTLFDPESATLNEKDADHAFEIRFLYPGVQAYAFTFG